MSQDIDTSYFRKQVDKLIRFENPVDFDRTPGFILGVIDNKVELVLPFPESSEKYVESTDQFQVGSVSKVLAAIACAELHEQGQLSLRAVVSDNGLAMQDYLMHMAGLPRYPVLTIFTDNPNSAYDISAVEFEEYLASRDEVKGSFSYSHIGIPIVAHYVEQQLDMSFDQILAEAVTGPIGMDQTNYEGNRAVQGHDNAGHPAVLRRDFGPFRYSEGLYSTMDDLLKLCQYMLNDAPDVLWQPAHFPAFNKNTGAGLGWQVFAPTRRTRIYFHSGKTDTHSAFMGLVRETNTAVVVLANSSYGVHNLGYLVLRMLNNNWKRKKS